MSNIFKIIKSKSNIILLALMLELLHLSIWLDFGSLLSKSLMLVHFGLFLIWQPIWKSDERLRLDYGILFITLTFLTVYWLNLWLLFTWLVLLIGFVSGRVITIRSERAIFLIVVIFLVSQLFMACTTMLANTETGFEGIFKIVLPLLPVVILFLPTVTQGPNTQYPVDLLHAINTSMLASLVSMGSLLNMYLNNTTYIIALIQVSVAIGLCIIFISWLLTSQSRYSEFTQLWSNSLLNIGTPFELWITELSIHAEKQETANAFLEAAMQELANFEWISGVSWSTKTSKGTIGEINTYELNLKDHDLHVKLYTYGATGGALQLHCQLLIKLVCNLYIGKIREKELTKQTHLKAIYETGARITHDIKNLLQSLHAITSVLLIDSSDADKAVTQDLLKRQLPTLTQRLQLALDKLQSPIDTENKLIYLKDWWQDIQSRNEDSYITFESDIYGDPLIPVDLFDSVFDNLKENFQSKLKSESNITAKASLLCNDKSISLKFSDNGKAIPENISKVILFEPLNSDNGLGIGLYQAALQAQSVGYELILHKNQD
ncbi:MAG: hypothetical protein MI865_04625, partial [Proteobacteria bacterium]|nr:hypothetical protein [Pseudomonadota bacterium]